MPLFESSVEFTKKLISFPSVSSSSNREVSDWVSEQLEKISFEVEQTHYVDQNGVEKVNVLGKRCPLGQGTRKSSTRESAPKSGLAYFCHTDVVPTQGWNGPGEDPFVAQLGDDRIYGRGSCDMKGSLAVMLAAAESIPASEQTEPLWIVCTADEEVGFMGAKNLVQHSPGYKEIIDRQPLGLIGEPTNLNVVHAHKGIVGLRITSQGKAAHSSTNHGLNANLKMVPLLERLLDINRRTENDARYQDSRFNPPILSWNFGFSDGCTAVNITPGQSTAWLSLRPMPRIDGADLLDEVYQLANDLGLHVAQCGEGPPMWIDPESAAIKELCDITNSEPITVCYGTDGGEFHDLRDRVVFGPGDIAQAHTTDEWIALKQLEEGTQRFSEIIKRWCC